MGFISRGKEGLFDSDSEKIFNEIIECVKYITKDLNIIKVKKERLEFLEKDLSESNKLLTELEGNKSRKTFFGKLAIQELHNIAIRAKRNVELLKLSSNENEAFQAITEIYNFIDKIRSTKMHIENLPYPYAGITVAGFICSVIPFLNLLSIVFGGYLALSSDRRAQTNGILMIIIVIVILLISFLI